MFGGIVKLLYVAAVAWLVYKLYRTLKGGARRVASNDRPPTDGGGRLEGGELIQDPHCGVYVPKKDSVAGPGGRHFCSEACRDAHAEKPN